VVFISSFFVCISDFREFLVFIFFVRFLTYKNHTILFSNHFLNRTESFEKCLLKGIIVGAFVIRKLSSTLPWARLGTK
jgi:hypothetical protein